MNCCSHCKDAGKFFNKRTAKRELRSYKRKGPKKTTRLLLNEIRKKDLSGKSLLDIGGGIGSITFELIEQGIETSVHIDASSPYLELSLNEAERRGLKDRVRHIHGDFTEISNKTDMADIVTLDRVICCYPDMEKLVDKSTEKAAWYFGVVYPRERWLTRLGMKAGNFWFQIRGSDFRTYLHSPSDIDSRIQRNGFHKIFHKQTLIWEVALYEHQ